jgi:hypothetical protein
MNNNGKRVVWLREQLPASAAPVANRSLPPPITHCHRPQHTELKMSPPKLRPMVRRQKQLLDITNETDLDNLFSSRSPAPGRWMCWSTLPSYHLGNNREHQPWRLGRDDECKPAFSVSPDAVGPRPI